MPYKTPARMIRDDLRPIEPILDGADRDSHLLAQLESELQKRLSMAKELEREPKIGEDSRYYRMGVMFCALALLAFDRLDAYKYIIESYPLLEDYPKKQLMRSMNIPKLLLPLPKGINLHSSEMQAWLDENKSKLAWNEERGRYVFTDSAFLNRIMEYERFWEKDLDKYILLKENDYIKHYLIFEKATATYMSFGEDYVIYREVMHRMLFAGAATLEEQMSTEDYLLLSSLSRQKNFVQKLIGRLRSQRDIIKDLALIKPKNSEPRFHYIVYHKSKRTFHFYPNDYLYNDTISWLLEAGVPVLSHFPEVNP